MCTPAPRDARRRKSGCNRQQAALCGKFGVEMPIDPSVSGNHCPGAPSYKPRLILSMTRLAPDHREKHSQTINCFLSPLKPSGYQHYLGSVEEFSWNPAENQMQILLVFPCLGWRCTLCILHPAESDFELQFLKQ